VVTFRFVGMRGVDTLELGVEAVLVSLLSARVSGLMQYAIYCGKSEEVCDLILRLQNPVVVMCLLRISPLTD